jgi:signal transduction histidine kinase
VYDGVRPLIWVPDLLVGLTYLSLGALAWRRSRPTGALMVWVGAAWFAGGAIPAAMFWHRAALLHLLLAYPAWHPRARPAVAAVIAGYVVSVLFPALWLDEWVAVSLAAGLVLVAWWALHTASGRARHRRRVAFGATVAVAVVLVGGSVARQLHKGAWLPSLLVYEVTLCGVALALLVGLRPPALVAVTDLVVDLADSRSGTLRGALARTLHDPDLQVGYWDETVEGYRDEEGRDVPLPRPGSVRVATAIERQGRPFALLVHDVALLQDQALIGALEVATQMTALNAERQAAVHAQVAEVAASRRRLLVAADEERRRLEQQLRSGVGTRLGGLAATLAQARGCAPDDEHLQKALSHLDQTVEDLDHLAGGLRPRELEAGLTAALACAAESGPVQVRLVGDVGRLPEPVELAAYYLCAEALSNVAKHAPGAAATISVRCDDDMLRLVVEDDGPGGATARRGGGLVGLRDRLESLGGQLTIDSDGRGTRLAAQLPLNHQPR